MPMQLGRQWDTTPAYLQDHDDESEMTSHLDLPPGILFIILFYLFYFIIEIIVVSLNCFSLSPVLCLVDFESLKVLLFFSLLIFSC